MRRADIRAIGEVGGEAAAAISTVVEEMHEGIAERSFAPVSAAATPVRVIHDGVAALVYASVRGGLRSGARLGAALAAGAVGDEGPALVSTRRGALALGALNGLYGDRLAARDSPLAVPMDFRRHGREVPLTPTGLADAYPDAGSRVAVFVHGLMEDDECWRIFPRRGHTPERLSYGERLRADAGITPVHVRYNSGRRISDNGRALAAALDDLICAWPVQVEEIVLIGHSMGGLLARSACHYADREGRGWRDRISHVFCLGSPHLGADLEKGLNVLGHGLGRLPETRGLARLVNARSVGIKDLRYGACLEEDWRDYDPDEFLRHRCTEVPFLPGAHYFFIAASLREGPVGELLGDLLVRVPSASGGTGRGRRIPFPVDNGCQLTGANHFDLLNHPAVYQQLRTWITR
jgi:pimeloyl-ACP methyl ester carboxylesterase